MSTPRRITGLPARSRSVSEQLLEKAGVKGSIVAAQGLGIGSAGLNVRGNRDEDGSHFRLQLDEGASVIYREYATTAQSSNAFLRKEKSVMKTLRDAGLPTPQFLAAIKSGASSERDPAAMLLSDPGGEPLEEVFRANSPGERDALWGEVGSQLRRLHSVDVSLLSILTDPAYQQPWTRMLPYFEKSLGKVKKSRPEFAPAINDLMELIGSLESYLESKRRCVCFNSGYYLPGMMMQKEGKSWDCVNWLSLGYYVSISDPDRDVVSISVHHREWTGDEVPDSFFDAYGSRPDEISELLYGNLGQLNRGVAYENLNSGLMRKGFGPPPHSIAVQQLHKLPESVDRMRSLLMERRP